MSFGSAVRSALGPLERPAIRLYRDWFVDLDELARDVAALGPFRRILEIGVGDGVLCQRITEQLPGASYLGIDIADDPGRMFDGDWARVEFRQISTTELIAEGGAPFDLVLISDVIHHVPDEARAQLLVDAAALLAPDGVLVVKDWDRNRSASHLMAELADRYISGDRTVDFLSREQLVELLARSVPELRVHAEFRVPPRRNNVLFALRASNGTTS